MINYYEVLKVRTDATQSQIKQAFLNLVSKYHPDIYDGDKAYAEDYTATLTEAYAVLRDPVRRRDYDIMQGIGRKKYSKYAFKETQDNDYEETSKGTNFEQEMSRKHFRNNAPKKLRRNIFARIFKSKLLYILIFVFAIEMAIILFVHFKLG